MEPTRKSPAVESELFALFGFSRRVAISGDVCVPAPIGCGKPVDLTGQDDVTVREYRISGLCPTCQDAIFGDEEG
jgi:hypothetical protein